MTRKEPKRECSGYTKSKDPYSALCGNCGREYSDHTPATVDERIKQEDLLIDEWKDKHDKAIQEAYANSPASVGFEELLDRVLYHEKVAPASVDHNTTVEMETKDGKKVEIPAFDTSTPKPTEGWEIKGGLPTGTTVPIREIVEEALLSQKREMVTRVRKVISNLKLLEVEGFASEFNQGLSAAEEAITNLIQKEDE